MCRIALAAAVAVALGTSAPRDARADDRSFAAGSLIIPMDLSYQDTGMLQAYGLLFQLLRQGVPIYWMIDDEKTFHAAPCNTVNDECAWDCAEEGSGIKCPYPTASPDFYAAARVVWDDDGDMNPGDTIANHGYRGGPFVIDSADAAAAMPIIDAWNDQAEWAANPWAMRTVFHVVTVHEATAAFTGWVRKDMVAAPTIAVFSDGNEDIATEYLRAAGIPQSNGSEFPAAKCGANNCGPDTANPDMLTVPSIMGDMGTCDAVNYDHRNGSLFTDDGVPAFCQIMSMHWGVNDREDVQCNGGGCPAAQEDCAGETITYHGHEVVAEVRKFLEYPVHFFAECQAVNAYENTVPNPEWPYLDDDERIGHFLTTTGMPPDCAGSCTDGDFECVVGGCDDGTRDCCLPKDVKEKGAGFLIAGQPNADTLQFLHAEVPYAQLDGFFATIGGSEPAYNLSAYLGTEYKNDREVTFITGPNGPGDHDVWMSGFVDGECEIVGGDDVGVSTGECNGGKVSYLGGHAYSTNVPLSSNANSQGTRLFLNALFEADCVTSVGQPSFDFDLAGDLVIGTSSVPVEGDYVASFSNAGRGVALDAVFAQDIPSDVVLITSAGGDETADGVEWTIGSISADPPLADAPPSNGSRASTLRFGSFGEYQVELRMRYRVGQSTFDSPAQTFTIRVALDSDGDMVPDEDDDDPDDPNVCSDIDQDTCDDCSVTGMQTPDNDGPDADGDGICDAGDPDNPGDGDPSGGCCQGTTAADAAPWLLVLPLLFWRRRRRRSVTAV